MTDEQTRRGLAAGVGAFLIWGTMPLYIHMFMGIPAADVLAHRVLWAFVLLAAAVAAIGGWPRLRAALRIPRLMVMLAASGALIAINWLIYTWAVLNGRALDTSLGYFMQPLLNVAIGVLLLKERFPCPSASPWRSRRSASASSRRRMDRCRGCRSASPCRSDFMA